MKNWFELKRKVLSLGMRVRAFTAVLCLVFVLFTVVSLAIPYDANADRYWGWNKAKRKRAWTYGLILGARLSAHYNQSAQLSTPPQSMLGEAHLSLWYKTNFAFYGLFGKSILYADTSMYGGGFKFPFLQLQAPAIAFISGITMNIQADMIRYQIRPAVFPESYDGTGFTYRYGGSINWGFGKSSFYLDTTMMVGPVSGNFFIMPFVGIGAQF